MRPLVGTFAVVASLFAVTQAQAQTCDPYRTRIPIDYRTYLPPSGETTEAFFAALDQGTPVAELTPYVWRYDNQGWFWSCLPTSDSPTPGPSSTPIWLQVGHYYETGYGDVFKVTGINQFASGIGDYYQLQYVTPNGGYCGRLAFRKVSKPATDVLREVAPRDIDAGCQLAIILEQ